MSNVNLCVLAKELAKFLNELHKIDITDAPIPDEYDFYRGGDLANYDMEFQNALQKLDIDKKKALQIWAKGLRTQSA